MLEGRRLPNPFSGAGNAVDVEFDFPKKTIYTWAELVEISISNLRFVIELGVFA